MLSIVFSYSCTSGVPFFNSSGVLRFSSLTPHFEITYRCIRIIILIVLFVYSEFYVYSIEIEESRRIHRNFLIFIVSEYHFQYHSISRTVNEMARNLAGYLHVPGPLLKDIGFMFIPEFTNKPISHFGYTLKLAFIHRDLLSFIPFMVMIGMVLSMEYKQMSAFVSDQLRVFSIYYFVRACCETLTLLPGPAEHCRPGSTFHPPREFGYVYEFISSWIDVVSHMPVDGLSFSSCGDLIPSGHIGFVVLGLIAIVRNLPYRLAPCTISWCV